MHHPLPEEVVAAIAKVYQHNVSHRVVWGQLTQLTYPGESMWKVDHWADLEKVCVMASRDGLKVEGIETVKAALEKNEKEQEDRPSDADLQNTRDALKAILEVMETALTLIKTDADQKTSVFIQVPILA